MPIDLVLVRHGESEGNLAHQRAHAGDHSVFSNVHFKAKHNPQWRLTDKGCEQAIAAGKYLKENRVCKFRFFPLFGICSCNRNKCIIGSPICIMETIILYP